MQLTAWTRAHLDYPAVTQRSLSSHLAVTQQSPSSHSAVTQQSLSSHLAVTQQSPSSHSAVTQQSPSRFHIRILTDSRGKETRYRLNRKLSGLQSWSVRLGEETTLLSLLGSNPGPPSPWLNRYIDYSVLVQELCERQTGL
jgi:hypothetical protein